VKKSLAIFLLISELDCDNFMLILW